MLSRDRFGIKPLFVADAGRALAFASELRCFDRSLPPFSHLFELDAVSAHAMMSWSYVPELSTIYRGVKRLAPATRLTINLATGERDERTFFRPTPSAAASRIDSLDDACTEVDALLRRAVREHLESDVPVATFLSGGIDSSLVTAYAVEQSAKPVRAFTIGFEEPAFDESRYARETAEKIGIPIQVEVLDETRAQAGLLEALTAYDEPFGDSSSLAMYLLSKHVGASYKVALGGDGGDEVFAGYAKYRIIPIRRALALAPALRDGVAQLMSRAPSRMDRTSTLSELLRRFGRLSAGLHGPPDAAYARLTQFAALDRSAPLMVNAGGAEVFVDAARRRYRDAVGTELQRSLASDLYSPLPNDMLTKVDRASMACQLEARVPFLDHRVVEVGLGLPERFTLGSRGGKRVLRALHEKRFGKALARRKKAGFGVPVERWLRTKLDRACDRLFEKKRLDRYGLLSSAALSDGGFREWLVKDPLIVWYAFVLSSWCEANLGDGRDSLRELLVDEPRNVGI